MGVRQNNLVRAESSVFPRGKYKLDVRTRRNRCYTGRVSFGRLLVRKARHTNRTSRVKTRGLIDRNSEYSGNRCYRTMSSCPPTHPSFGTLFACAYNTAITYTWPGIDARDRIGHGLRSVFFSDSSAVSNAYRRRIDRDDRLGDETADAGKKAKRADERTLTDHRSDAKTDGTLAKNGSSRRGRTRRVRNYAATCP